MNHDATDSQPSISRDDLRDLLVRQVFDYTAEIGDPDNSSTGSPLSTPDQAAIKTAAYGMRRVLESVGEHFAISYDTLHFEQFDGALGERFHRVSKGCAAFASRALNNLVREIRAKRLAMQDQYDMLEYSDWLTWKKKLEKISRQEKPDREAEDAHWRECQTVRTELAALNELQHEHVRDKSWFAEYYRRRQAVEKTIRENIQ